MYLQKLEWTFGNIWSWITTSPTHNVFSPYSSLTHLPTCTLLTFPPTHFSPSHPHTSHLPTRTLLTFPPAHFSPSHPHTSHLPTCTFLTSSPPHTSHLTSSFTTCTHIKLLGWLFDVSLCHSSYLKGFIVRFGDLMTSDQCCVKTEVQYTNKIYYAHRLLISKIA